MIGIFLQGITLGLSTGLFCLTSCALVFVPLLISQKRGARQNLGLVAELAAGRFAAYMIFGGTAGALGTQLEGIAYQRMLGGMMVVLALLMLGYAVSRCYPRWTACHWARLDRIRYPLLFGFITGINPCPPFLLALSYALELGGAIMGTILFLGFFLGTSLYLLLLLPAGWLGRWESVNIIGRITAALAGVFFLFTGLTRIGISF